LTIELSKTSVRKDWPTISITRIVAGVMSLMDGEVVTGMAGVMSLMDGEVVTGMAGVMSLMDGEVNGAQAEASKDKMLQSNAMPVASQTRGRLFWPGPG